MQRPSDYEQIISNDADFAKSDALSKIKWIVQEQEDIYVPNYSISEDPENPAIPLVRYMIALTRCPLEEVAELITMAKGKYADELDIPVSDEEEDFLAEAEEEDE